jgi:hypothetical protein
VGAEFGKCKTIRELVLRNERKRQLQSTFENIDERARSKCNKSDKFGDRIFEVQHPYRMIGVENKYSREELLCEPRRLSKLSGA